MKKKRVALLMCFVLVLGCLTGCAEPRPSYQGTGRSIAINGYKSEMTTVNFRFYDYHNYRLVNLSNDTYPLPGSLNTTEITFIDNDLNEYTIRVNRPLHDAPDCLWYICTVRERMERTQTCMKRIKRENISG